jgi:hypothetical protein
MRKIVAAFFIIAAAVFGCTTPDGNSPPPTPLEAKILAQTITSVALAQEDLSQDKLKQLQGVFVGIKGVMVNTISENPGDLEPVMSTFLKDVDPVYQDVTEGVVQILLIRVRPFLDVDNPDLLLARAYIEAILDGAIAAVNRALTRLETGIGSDLALRDFLLDGLRA